MQHFISEGSWDDDAVLRRHWQEVAVDLGDEDGVYILDGSEFAKQGMESVGVKRQYCGELGKTANCQAGVFLGYASRHGYTLLDRRLYLPKEWVIDEGYADPPKVCCPRGYHLQDQAHAGHRDAAGSAGGRNLAGSLVDL
jgi:SRSO17 transposase